MIYDYKSDEITQEVFIKCLCPLIDDLIDEYYSLHRYENLSIYVPASIAKEIVGKLLDEIEDLWVHTDSENELLYKDDNEVVITIGYDGMIFIEDAKGNDCVIKSNEDCCLTYIYDGFSKKDVDILEKNAESILIFGFEEDEIDNDENTEISTTSTTTYFVNGKKVNKDIYDEFVKEFDNKYNEIVDEMNVFRRLFW